VPFPNQRSPEDARWNAERRAVKFRVEIRRVPRGGPGAAARVPAPASGAAHPERCVEASASRIVRAASLLLVALAVVLLMTPAAYHRIVYAGEDAQDMHRVGRALVTAATAPLALGLAGDVYVVITKIAESPAVGLAAGSLALISLIGLWYAYPLLAASIRTGPIP
jgi:hypothetical protein